MKHIWIALLVAASLTLTACGGSDKPNLDDPKAVAEFTCAKMKDIMKMMEQPEANMAKIEALGNEMDKFDEEFKKHHGDKAHDMQLKVDEQLEIVCADLAKEH